MSKYKTELTKAFLASPKYGRLISWLVTISMLVFTYYLVYVTGGIKFVYSHTMYIAIIFAGFNFGIYGGVFIGLIGGFLLGPIMPLDVATGEMQETINWVYRLIVFSVIGGLVGYLTKTMKLRTDRIVNLLTCDIETRIPLFRSLFTTKTPNIGEDDSLIMLRTINQQEIVDSLNQEFYYGALREIYKTFNNNKQDDSQMFMVDYSRMVILLKTNEIDIVIKQLKSWVFDSLYVLDIPLHIEMSFGVLMNIDVNDMSKTISNVNEAACAAYKKQTNFIVYEDIDQLHGTDVLLVGEFGEAIKNNDLRIVLHPIFNLRTGEIAQFEALSRWEHERHGNIPPDTFIPLITNTQLISSLTKNVIKKLKDIQSHIQEELPNIRFSFNICPRCIYNKNNLDYVISEVKDGCFELELTEEMFIENIDAVEEAFNKLSEASIKINIDDFGKGYSSLSYLSEFTFHKVKIDKMFNQDLSSNKKHQEIVSFIIKLAHSLNKEVVAEGVEDEATLNILKELNCDYAQGFYFTKPLEIKDVLPFVKKHN